MVGFSDLNSGYIGQDRKLIALDNVCCKYVKRNYLNFYLLMRFEFQRNTYLLVCRYIQLDADHSTSSFPYLPSVTIL